MDKDRERNNIAVSLYDHYEDRGANVRLRMSGRSEYKLPATKKLADNSFSCSFLNNSVRGLYDCDIRFKLQ